MDPAIATIALEGLFLTALLSVPILAASLLAGILSSASQTSLGVRDPGLLTAPRIALVFGAAVCSAPWVASELVTFTQSLWTLFP